MTLRTPRQIALIVNSFRKVFETNDIEYLSKSAYNYVYLCSGFIAHYNHAGFKAAYENVNDLIDALYANEHFNQWRNFNPGDRDYAYYMEKRNIYNLILDTERETCL